MTTGSDRQGDTHTHSCFSPFAVAYTTTAAVITMQEETGREGCRREDGGARLGGAAE